MSLPEMSLGASDLIRQYRPQSSFNPGALARDKHGRFFRALRLSVTPACNMSCSYCNPLHESFRSRLQKPDFYLELLRRLLAVQPFTEMQITGGEPTLYPYLEDLIRGLSGLELSRISLTTNGLSLFERAGSLQKAGLNDLNVSLDALDEKTFERITGCQNLQGVLAGIEKAQEVGLSVKINCTVMRGVNEKEILPLLEYASSKKIVIRYLELMSMGPLRNSHHQYFFSQDEILNTIQSRFQIRALGRSPHATASYWQTESGRFGIIANHSSSFCNDCDRLRILHDGRISGCLSSENTYSVQGSRDASSLALQSGSMRQSDISELQSVLQQALADKALEFCGSSVFMQATGG